MIGIPLGLAFANATEWVVHKHVLHGLGRNKKSFWAFHWHDHHRASRKHGHVDTDYWESVVKWNGQGKEALTLSLLTLSTTPLLPVAPFFVATCYYSAVNYYIKHRRSHLDPEWARENLPWHYDHHMGPNQDANWCVTRPWFDIVLGTRAPYVGTVRELRDRARQRARAQARVSAYSGSAADDARVSEARPAAA